MNYEICNTICNTTSIASGCAGWQYYIYPQAFTTPSCPNCGYCSCCGKADIPGKLSVIPYQMRSDGAGSDGSSRGDNTDLHPEAA
jgi:hypothetical protein